MISRVTRNLAPKTIAPLAYPYSLDKYSMASRSKLLYKENGDYDPETIKYNFHILLQPGDKYRGVAQIAMNLQQRGDTFLDFQGQDIRNLVVNGKTIENMENIFTKGRINLNQNLLVSGVNHICVHYENKYDKDGSGCVSFTDVDGKQYLYTQFEPYMGNRVFPMFDQPDLKAKMNLTISCPASWEAVLSN